LRGVSAAVGLNSISDEGLVGVMSIDLDIVELPLLPRIEGTSLKARCFSRGILSVHLL
jgi:hypothetical protein